MGVCNIPDISQGKIYEIFEGFDMVSAYIDNLLVITKYDFKDNLKALGEILQRLSEPGLKVIP